MPDILQKQAGGTAQAKPTERGADWKGGYRLCHMQNLRNEGKAAW